MTKLWGRAAAVGALCLAVTVNAADHIDSLTAVDEPTADITDIYAWMSADASKLNLVMNVVPFAEATSAFSDSVQYVFHINSSSAYGETQTESRIICEFDAAGTIQCWGGGSYVTGDASTPAGLNSSNDVLKVFAGPRDDPFFFEFGGFTATVNAVIDAAGGLTFDAEGCPALDEPTSTALVTQLMTNADASPATDDFAGANVRSLVVQIDKTTISAGGPILGVWASTHSK